MRESDESNVLAADHCAVQHARLASLNVNRLVDTSAS